jgi:hypothetical protein
MKKIVLLCGLVVSTVAQAVDEPATSAASTPPAAAVSPSAGPPTTALATSASALANAVQARTPEEQANQSGFQLQLALDHYLGLGTFVDASRYSYLAANLTIAPVYLFGIGRQRLVASATVRLNYEYTLPDVDTGRRTQVSDTRVGISAPALYRETHTGIALSPGVSLALPTSLESWHAGLITNLGVNATFSRSVSTVDLRFTVSGSRGFFASAQNGVLASTSTDARGNLLVISRQGEPVSAFANWNTAWSFSVGGQVQWRATGSLLFYAGYSFSKSWRYAATLVVDEFTAQGTDANGNPVARAGPGQSDRTAAFVGASYQVNEHYTLDLGLSTIQAPLTATGLVRFPFLSFGSWADNASSLYFTLGAAY